MKKKNSISKGIRYFVVLLICCSAFMLNNKIYAQSSCSTASSLNDTICNSGLSSNLQTRWYSFTAHSANLYLQLISDSTIGSAYGAIELYSGSCASLTRIDSSRWEKFGRVLSHDGLTVSSTYYIKLSKSDTLNAHYDLCFLLRTANLGCTNCNTTGCEMVCNYSMENNSGDPGGFSQIYKASCWGIPTGPGVGTTDYFTTSGGAAVDVPNNDNGSESPHTGNAYAGILVYRDFSLNDPNVSNSCREYLVGKFACPLSAGITYNVSFWVSLGDNSGYAVKGLGAYISSTVPYQNYYGPLFLTPQILDNVNFITQDAGWYQISGQYTASGGEQYITIGKFDGDGSTTHTAHTPADPSSYNRHYSYYYIDDVSAQPIPVRTVSQAPAGVCAPHPVTLIIHPDLCGQSSVWSASQGSVTCYGTSNCDSTVFSNPLTSVDSTVFTIVTTIGGTCRDTFHYVFRPNGSSFTVNAGNNDTVCPGTSVILTGSTTGAGQSKEWKISGGNILCSNCTTTTVTPTTTTNYVYFVTDSTSGCTKTDTVKVVVNAVPTIHIVPLVSGGITTCADSLLFTISQSGYFSSFSWTTDAPGYSGQYTAGLHTHWTGQTTWGYVVVIGTTGEGCTRKDSLPIPSCCKSYDPESSLQPNLVNDSSSHVSATYSTLFSYNSSTQTYTATDKQFSINGIFIVNYKTQFIGCDVKLGPNAKIIISPGKFLLLDKSSSNTTKLHACSEMWDGIYIDGTNSSTYLKVVSGTVIEDAKNAIVSTNGGNFVIDGSNGTVKLNKNNIGVLIKPYQNTHPGIIRKTIISCDSPSQPGGTSGITTSGNSCRAPVNGQAFCAIYIDSCSNVTIGDSTQNSYRNTMERQKYGIYAKNSNVKVWNNDLKYFIPVIPPPKANHVEGIAVYASGSSSLTRTMTVGRIGNYKAHNLIRKCSFGVMAENYMNLNCEYNRLDSITTIGVYGLNSLAGRTILVNKDSITEFTGTGVNCTNVQQSTITITNNQLNETSSSTPTSFGLTGIYVANALNFTVSTVKIQNNLIKRVRNGIWVLNLKRAQVMDNGVNFYTTQNFSQQYPAIGVKFEAVHNSLIKNNTVAYINSSITQAAALSNYYNKIFGIHITRCVNDTITKNTIQKCGSGIFLKSANYPCLIGCNSMSICYYGVNFGYLANPSPSVYTTSQFRWGNPFTGVITPTGNTWTNCNNDLKGTANPAINWYYNNSSGSPQPANSNLSTTGITMTSTSDTNYCITLARIVAPVTAANLRDAELSAICKTPHVYDTLNAEYHYIDSVFAYQTIKDNPSWTSLGTADDSYYSGWYSTVASGNVGKLAAVEDSIKAKALTGAASLLATITPNGTPETNRVTVLGIYLNTWAKDSMTLDSITRVNLHAVADLAPISGGTAVYDARAMLFEEIHDSSALRMAPSPIVRENIPGHIYPNPTTGVMMLNYELPEGKTGSLQLYDITGRVIHSYALSAGTQVQQFNAAELPAGLYFYTVFVDGNAVLSEKVVIIKQE
jgi:parallel beta-helix repeat protein